MSDSDESSENRKDNDKSSQESLSPRNQDSDIEQEFKQQQQKQMPVIVPGTYKQQEQRACIRCHLIKSQAQFEQAGCDNCTPLFRQAFKDDYKLQRKKLYTRRFQSMMCIMQPYKSWIAKRILQVEKNLVSGAYALKVDADSGVLEMLDDLSINWVKEQ